MENKRKAAGSNEAGPADGEDRAAKRRKQHQIPQSLQSFDLFAGESPESTTAYGLSFLEQIRRTTDKNGRFVAVYFENLLPRDENKDYYSKIRMPISLQTIEQKLKSNEFANLAELESYFKRMVTNAKEYYNRGSEVYENAERVRKALSNYMVKTNPAYKLIAGYSCHPTPLPPEPEPQHEEPEQSDDAANGGGDAEGEEDVDGDEEEQGQDEEDDDSDAGPEAGASSRRSHRNSAQLVQKTAEKFVPGKTKPDHEYEGVAYSRLSFQQAQEKVVEEMIREEDEDEPGWMKFEAFLNLPPRSLKEYFSVITKPLSLKALQKLVKGIHGRQAATGASDFKTWAAFEEKASLLWTNAHYFNEEGSPIYNLATELQRFFVAQVAEAKAAVPEPAPKKIKLKVQQVAQESQPTPPPPLGPKKITIHVGGSRGSAAASPAPAPPAGRSGDSGPPEMSQNGGPPQPSSLGAPNGGPPAATNLGQAEIARSVSASAASPSPSLAGLKQDPMTRQSPAMGPPANGALAHPIHGPNGVAIQGQPVPGQVMPGQVMQSPSVPQQQLFGPAQDDPHRIPSHPPKPLYDGKHRAPGRSVADALIRNLVVRAHPSIKVDKRFIFELPAHPKLAQQSVTIMVPSNQDRLQIIPILPPLEQQQRQYRLFVMLNGNPLGRSAPIPIPSDDLQLTANTLVFDASLRPGINWIEVHVIAALPKDQRLPNGADCELEKILLVTHLLR